MNLTGQTSNWYAAGGQCLLVEEIRRIWQGIASVPPSQDVTNDPNALVSVFGRLKFLDQELEVAAVIGIRRVDEVQQIRAIPEISIETYDAQLGILRMIDRVCGVAVEVERIRRSIGTV